MKTYLEHLADTIRREAGDSSTDNDLLYLIYAVLLRSSGRSVDASAVHDAWAAWAIWSGRSGPQAVPWESLTSAEKALDAPFVEAIRRVAAADSMEMP